MSRSIPYRGEIIDATPGTLYDYAPLTKKDEVIDRHRQGTYEVVCDSLCAGTRQQQVVYRGVGGPDHGRCYTCSVHDFATRFVPHPLTEES